MPSVVIFKVGQNPQQVIEFISSVDPGSFLGRADAKVYDNISNPGESQIKFLVETNPLRYLKVVGNDVQVMTAGERSAVDAAEEAASVSAVRRDAKNQIIGRQPSPMLLRALADILKDEINILRGWTVSFKAEVAAAATLADLKTRVASLPNLNDRTLDQLKTAINNRIDAGTVDN